MHVPVVAYYTISMVLCVCFLQHGLRMLETVSNMLGPDLFCSVEGVDGAGSF